MLNGRSQIAETVETPRARLYGAVSGVAFVCTYMYVHFYSIQVKGTKCIMNMNALGTFCLNTVDLCLNVVLFGQSTDTIATDIAVADTIALTQAPLTSPHTRDRKRRIVKLMYGLVSVAPWLR